jgi:hypothetical protein
MSDWAIRIPYRRRDDLLADVDLAARRELEGEDAMVTRHLATAAMLAGDRTAGDLIDRIDRATPAQRRRLLDEARQAIGLERSEDIDTRERFAALNETVRLRKQNTAEPPPEERPRFSPSGAILIADGAAIEAERQADEARAEARRQRRAEREAEAAAIKRARERLERERAGDPYYDPPVANIPTWRLGPR